MTARTRYALAAGVCHLMSGACFAVAVHQRGWTVAGCALSGAAWFAVAILYWSDFAEARRR